MNSNWSNFVNSTDIIFFWLAEKFTTLTIPAAQKILLDTYVLVIQKMVGSMDMFLSPIEVDIFFPHHLFIVDLGGKKKYCSNKY